MKEMPERRPPRMTDRQIRCFLALYETLNFSAAARQLFLTQPTLSYQIRTLEEELGTPLFTRTTCRVEPPKPGSCLPPLPRTSGRAIRRSSMHWPPGPPGAKNWCCRCR